MLSRDFDLSFCMKKLLHFSSLDGKIRPLNLLGVSAGQINGRVERWGRAERFPNLVDLVEFLKMTESRPK